MDDAVEEDLNEDEEVDELEDAVGDKSRIETDNVCRDSVGAGA